MLHFRIVFAWKKIILVKRKSECAFPLSFGEGRGEVRKTREDRGLGEKKLLESL